MASFLDAGLMQYFAVIFPFLFVLFLVYAVLASTKILGENKTILAIISFVLAIFVVMSPIAAEIIRNMAPWFVLLIVFGIFLLLIFKLGGVSDSDITNV